MSTLRSDGCGLLACSSAPLRSVGLLAVLCACGEPAVEEPAFVGPPAPVSLAPTDPPPPEPEPVAVVPEGDAEPEDAAPPPPINDLLLTAAEKGAVGDQRAAIESWREAYAGFEKTVEPGLRQRCDACATEIEYQFGLVRAELGRPGSKPLPLVTALRAKIEPYLPLPEPEKPGAPAPVLPPAPDVPPDL